jgi:hypothetical protein
MTNTRMYLYAVILSLAASPMAGAVRAERLASADQRIAEAGFDHSYAAWDGILKKHVRRDGMVDYAGLRSNEALTTFLDAVANVAAEEVAGWTRSQKIAFYCNAYNAYTFKTILDAWPVSSIRDIEPDAWETSKWQVAGRTMSLNEMEHKKLRGDLKEIRVHFVLVCAAKSCPVLPNKAIVPDGISAQLDRYAKAFFTDTVRNRVDQAGGKVYLSKLTDWYRGDFGDNPAAYMAKFVDAETRTFLEAGDFTVVFNDYDWSLNKQ